MLALELEAGEQEGGQGEIGGGVGEGGILAIRVTGMVDVLASKSHPIH